jgi:hypothetical protein
VTAWTLLPTLVVRSTGFPWETVERLAHWRSACAADSLLDMCDEADRVRAELPPGLRLTRGQHARLRSYRPLPPGCPAPADWLQGWNTVTEAIAAARGRLSAATTEDEREAAAAFAALVADPRFLDAVACSGPGVFRDITKGRLAATRLRRQVASYAQRLATKCETMSFFGPINYATIRTGLETSAVLSWQGYRACAARRAYLSAWAFDQVQSEVLADSRLLAALVPRRKTFAGIPTGDAASAALAGHADGSRTLADISARDGLTPGEAARALKTAVDRGFLTHDLMPAATEIDPVRWLSRRLGARTGEPGKRLQDVIRLLERYPAADAASKLALQAELGDAGRPAQAGTALPPTTEVATPAATATAAGRPKFYNDRLPVTEAAAGTLDLQVGGELARDLAGAVPVVLDVLAHVAMRTRRHTNGNLARELGPGRFPFTSVLRKCAGLPVAHDSWLRDNIALSLASAGPETTEIDLAGLLPTPPPPELPVLCSVDVMAATAVLASYRSGCTPLVIGDFHDAPLLTPWALQFHPDAAAVLVERDRRIRQALGEHRAVSVVARRSTGLPPLRFPGPVVEIGPVDEPAERIPLDRLYVLCDGKRACLRAHGHDGELFLHNGELDTGVHTAFALPRIRPPMLPDTCYLPRLRYGGVVLARRRWRLVPGPLGDAPDSFDGLALRRSLRSAGVPARFFAKASHERKPVYVDMDCPLLMDGLLRLARDAQTLHASELLPGPDRMWLRDGTLRFAAELRCVYLRSAGPGGHR